VNRQMAKRKVGRPTKYTKELGGIICALYAEGVPLRKIAKLDGMPDVSTIILWSFKNEEFSQQYTRAQEMRAELDAEEIREIADEKPTHEVPDPDGGTSTRIDPAGVNRNKLRVDTRKWLMARRLPKRYGDRIQQEVTGKDGGPLQLVTDIPRPKRD